MKDDASRLAAPLGVPGGGPAGKRPPVRAGETPATPSLAETLENKREEFVCEELHPAAGTFDPSGMARGEPGLPERFVWRGVEYRLAGVIRQWKTSGPCRSGSDEVYLRRHWYRIATDPPAILTIYCDRQAKDRRRAKRRWWVYSACQK